MRSFEELGEMAGAAITQALHIVDGLVVIGGGIAGAAKYILPGIMREMKQSVSTFCRAGISLFTDGCLQSGERERLQEVYEETEPSISKCLLPTKRFYMIAINVSG